MGIHQLVFIFYCLFSSTSVRRALGVQVMLVFQEGASNGHLREEEEIWASHLYMGTAPILIHRVSLQVILF